jgi:hypothetical protein
VAAQVIPFRDPRFIPLFHRPKPNLAPPTVDATRSASIGSSAEIPGGAGARRAEIGHYHHIAGQYLLRYAQESSWREDNRRVSNGEQVSRLAGLSLKAKPSVDFSGYWQRHVKDAA